MLEHAGMPFNCPAVPVSKPSCYFLGQTRIVIETPEHSALPCDSVVSLPPRIQSAGSTRSTKYDRPKPHVFRHFFCCRHTYWYCHPFPLPAAIVDDHPTRGACRAPSYDCTRIHQQLAFYSISRDSYNIFDYNLSKLRSMTYNSTLQYRDGVRCVGETKFLSCPFNNTISLDNTIIEP
ncbi:hypothetical protein EDB80DRAFT_150566 [Ilyonectria destructans]|nr:hypothetical protein EDB80DRAFT_150566 [Ilyonectria destructans]